MSQQYTDRPSNVKDRTGQRFERLVILRYAYTVRRPSGQNAQYWLCQCDCGSDPKPVSWSNLTSRCIVSCGCRNRENLCTSGRQITIGRPKKLFWCWQNLIRRCLDQTNEAWHNYGGRGITVCAEWERSFDVFREWAIRNEWQPGLEIDRINVNGNYEPSNCRWVTDEEQNRNKRNNRLVTIDGREQCVAAWADEIGIPHSLVFSRLHRGWDPVEALTTPKKRPDQFTNARLLTIDGVTRSVADWARLVGISPHAIYGRLKLGYGDKEAVMKPRRSYPEKQRIRQEA